MNGCEVLTFRGMRLTPSAYMTDRERVKRTWKERLFEKPWRPFEKTKFVRVSAKFFQVDKDEFLCTYQTYSEILKGIIK